MRPIHPFGHTLLCAALAAFPFQATAQLGPAQKVEFSQAQSMRYMDHGDIDGDGDQDLIVSTTFGPTWLMENAGNGRFLPHRHLPGPASNDKSLLLDLDEDGDLDHVYYSLNGQVRIQENPGNGSFGTATMLVQIPGTRQLFPADVDQDGDTDLVAWNEQTGILAVVWNLGLGAMSAPLNVPTGFTSLRVVDVADVDGDGLLDLVAGGDGIAWYRSLGTSFAPAQTLPTTSFSYGMQCGDLDGDGDVDMISSNFASELNTHINQGGGVFTTEQTLIQLVQAQELQLVDLDQDGDLDILYSSLFNRGWMRNQGDGQFDPAIELSDEGTNRITAVDITGDGLLDVVAAMNDHLAAHDATGSGFSSTRSLAKGTRAYHRVAAGDLDGDGFADIVGAVRNEDLLVWFRNDGTGRFGMEDTLSQGAEEPGEMRIVDIDGDGANDLVFMQDALDVLVWIRNEGGATFGQPQTITSTAFTSSFGTFDMADLDGDGDTDILTTVPTLGFACLLNDGAGAFIMGQVWGDAGRAISAIDFDGDGDVDVLYATNTAMHLALNDGNAAFTTALSEPISLGIIRSVGAMDMDDDGWNDLIVWGDNAFHAVRNAGDGTFVEFTMLMGLGIGNTSRAIGDVDGDGMSDIVVGGGSTITIRNKVIGTRFVSTSAGGTGINVAGYSHVVMVDLDNDGDLDVVNGAPNIGMLNCHLNYQISPFAIEGVVYHDADADGVRDPGEPNLPLAPVSITPQAAFLHTTDTGGYNALLPAGTYAVTAPAPTPFWSASTPVPIAVVLDAVDPVAQGIDIGLVVVDTTVVEPTVVLLPAVCSDTTTIHASVRNLGVPVQSGQLILRLDTALTFLEAFPPPTAQGGDSLVWDLAELPPMATSAVQVRAVMPSADLLPYELVMPITFTTPQTTALFTDTLMQPLACSYDPNDKLVEPVGFGPLHLIPIETGTIDYTIRFQNTGNAPAQSVRLLDVIPAELNVGSIVPLAWSHPISSFTVDANRRMVVRFDGIMLPDSASDPAGSQGFVRFRIAPNVLPPANYTDTENTAAIFFDLNEPVITNTTLTTWFECSDVTIVILLFNDSTLYTNAGDSARWFLNGEAVPGGVGDLLPIQGPGTYTVEWLEEGICLQVSEPYVYLTTDLRTNSTWAQVWPNPASDVLELQLGMRSIACVGLIDGLGRTVLPCTPVAGTHARLNVSPLEPGTYYLHGHLASGEGLKPMPVVILR